MKDLNAQLINVHTQIENTMLKTCVTIVIIEWERQRKLTLVAILTSPITAMECARTAIWLTTTLRERKRKVQMFLYIAKLYQKYLKTTLELKNIESTIFHIIYGFYKNIIF